MDDWRSYVTGLFTCKVRRLMLKKIYAMERFVRRGFYFPHSIDSPLVDNLGGGVLEL